MLVILEKIVRSMNLFFSLQIDGKNVFSFSDKKSFFPAPKIIKKVLDVGHEIKELWNFAVFIDFNLFNLFIYFILFAVNWSEVKSFMACNSVSFTYLICFILLLSIEKFSRI